METERKEKLILIYTFRESEKKTKVYIWFLPWRLGSFNKELKRGMVVRINIKIKATEVGKLLGLCNVLTVSRVVAWKYIT